MAVDQKVMTQEETIKRRRADMIRRLRQLTGALLDEGIQRLLAIPASEWEKAQEEDDAEAVAASG